MVVDGCFRIETDFLERRGVVGDEGVSGGVCGGVGRREGERDGERCRSEGRGVGLGERVGGERRV